MTNLLDNAIVRKYFGCNCSPFTNIMGGYHKENCNDKSIALRVIKAMQEPIREGDLVLELNGCGAPIGALERKSPHDIKPFHGLWLRLPDRFQPKPAVKECPNLTVTCSCGMKINHPDIATRRHEGEPPAAPRETDWMGCPIPKPTPPTERCCCGNKNPIHPKTLVCCNHASTDQAVEDKITSIVSAYSPDNSFRPALRASLVNLVLLARGGKG